MLMGKHKPTYTPFIDTGDHVIVINAAKVRLTGDKEERQDLSPPHRISGRLERNYGEEDAADAPGANDGGRDPGHAAEDQAGQADVPETEGLRRPEASAPGAATRRDASSAGGMKSGEKL